jgi:6-pyruvoyltetrahydropterin/6-carboxytetrahydropterin synthase
VDKTERAERYEVFVSKDDFKFNAAHFIAYPGFRERLHGHNYRVSVRITGPVGRDGYVVDFGDIKRAARSVCAEMNERTMIPTESDCIEVEARDGQIALRCEDGSRFSFPEGDCILLPITHTSAEKLAAYVCRRLVESLDALAKRGVRSIEVGVAEVPLQEARYTLELQTP